MDRKILIEKLAMIASAPSIGHQRETKTSNHQPVTTTQHSAILQSVHDFLSVKNRYQTD